MCGRYEFSLEQPTLREIWQQVQARFPHAGMEAGEIFPTSLVPVLLDAGGTLGPQPARWGFPGGDGASFLTDGKPVFAEPLPQVGRLGHRLEQQVDAAQFRYPPGEDFGDQLPAHPGDDDVGNPCKWQAVQPVRQPGLDLPFQPVFPNAPSCGVQRPRPDVGSEHRKGSATLHQRHREIAVVGPDVNPPAARGKEGGDDREAFI